ncbi:MAG: class I tRNA ligase family protein, partial [Planctomycetota bacterium]
RGKLCERKAGWDTHGLPVEVEVCKELGIHSKEEIEAYGIEPFIQKCQQSVWRYMQQWEQLTERLGFWVNLDEAYVTYHQAYVESVWWSLQRLFDAGLLYQGHKIVWWWAQGGTALSSGEVGQGYREVADPSVYVKFPLVDEPETSLLVWTTTPWTLPSNQFAAVHPELEYALVVDPEDGHRLYMAAALVETLGAKVKRELKVVSQCPGTDLLGRRYLPPFDFYYADHGQQSGRLREGGEQHVAWRVVPANFVTTDSGSGIVHQAPAFGEVDYEVLVAEQNRFEDGEGPELYCAIGPDGKFTDAAPPYQGRWVKDADKDISRDLREKGRLFHLDQYLHEYPFCWRADQDPLIQYPRRSWFVRTTQFKDAMLANNQQINWLPEHIRDGRFGNFLESNVDWALSRERYWGTPLPIWQCEQTGHQEAIGSYDQLLAKPDVQGVDVWEAAKAAHPELPDDLRVHKPYIDAVTYQSPRAADARMRRVPEVIDCWYDSGAMPFAQWGYRGQSDGEVRDRFASQFPADFISEALDQTRGWFYSLLAISTLLFSEEQEATGPSVPYPHPFRNCIVLGLMLSEWFEDKEGKVYLSEEDAKQSGGKFKQIVGKMSKSKRNYHEPQQIFDLYGADALRWYFFANQAPWTSIRYSERAIKDSIPEFMLRLWNVYSFFVIYANIDGFEPAQVVDGHANQLNRDSLERAASYRPGSERAEIDRWILSELHRTVAMVTERMDRYDNYFACEALNDFVDGLSNWYVRRSRDRFWTEDMHDPDKLDAYWTLYECLLTTAKLIAPFTPFLAETMWQNLAGVFEGRATESVHLCDYPNADEATIDVALSEQMRLAREISSLGRAARMEAKLKVRQPLAKVEVILAEETHREWLLSHAALIAKELNVKQVEFARDPEQYIAYQVKPNFKVLGPLVGKNMPAVKKSLLAADGSELLAQLKQDGKITLTLENGEQVSLTDEHVEVTIQAKEGWAAAQGKGCVVVLSTELTDALIREGVANDLIRLIQDQRKKMQLQYTDRIRVSVVTECADLRLAIEENQSTIAGETLADAITWTPLPGTDVIDFEAGGDTGGLYVSPASSSPTPSSSP